MTSQQDQKNEISTPDGDVEDQATGLSGGHAFWRHAGAADDVEAEPGDTATGSADGLAEPADPKAELDEDLAEEDDEDLADEDDEDLAEVDDENLADEDDDIIVAEPDDIVVAEVVEEEPAQTPIAADPTEAADITGTDIGQPQVAGITPASQAADARQPQADVAAAAPTDQAARSELGQQWRDIQAAFVDDPRDAVRLAAEATDEALNGVIDSLRSRLDGLSAVSGDSPEHRDTEQLRGELRQYRVLCQNLAEIQRRWAQPQPA